MRTEVSWFKIPFSGLLLSLSHLVSFLSPENESEGTVEEIEDNEDASNNNDNNDDEGEHDDNNDNMSSSSKAKAPPKKAKKAGPKTTGEATDFISPSPKKAPVRSYNINMADGWSCVRYSDGPIDYFFIEFHINGVLPDGGYKIAFAEDGMSVKFKRAIRKKCFAKHHLKAIIKDKYSNSHSLVTATDQNADLMRRERVDESGDYYWSADQIVYLEARCTGTPKFGYMEYPTGDSVQGHKQFNCVCTCRVQLADQRTNTMSSVHREVVNMLDLPSSQSSNDSPPHYPGNKRSRIPNSPDTY